MAPLENEKGAEEAKPEIVLKLEELDNKYLEIQKQYDKEMAALTKKYTEMQKPFLDKRTEALSKGEDDSSGTPACKGFWLQALQNHDARGIIEEHDEPVLEYVKDIVKEDLDDEDADKGYRLRFLFVANPYFEQTELKVEWHNGPMNPYNQIQDVTEIKATEIEWKDGKDVTVEKTVKKVKGGGAKKAKQKGKETIEPRASFFRFLFRNLKATDDMPEDLAQFMGDEEDDDEDLVEGYLEQTAQIGSEIKDSLIPFAVRWYTGEAKTDEDDDDDEESEEESDDDDDDDDDEDEEEDSPKGKKGGKKGGGAKADAKKEECKQQ